MNPQGFLADLEAKPAALRALADTLDTGDVWGGLPDRWERTVLVGMGSSRFAADVCARRMRGRGAAAWAEYASASQPGPDPAPGTLVVGISASGGTPETVEALTARGPATTVAITNHADSPIAEVADIVVAMGAGEEAGGVACRTYQHTLALLLALERRAARRGASVGTAARRAAEATEDLLERREAWLPGVADLLGEGPATFTIAPADRLASAEQAALMFREGPRRTADACEAGDWLHVDVYLTKPLRYRALLFGGSRFDAAILGWIRERGAEMVAVGADVEGAATAVRYRHDDDPEVALLTEVLVAELVAARWWLAQTGSSV